MWVVHECNGKPFPDLVNARKRNGFAAITRGNFGGALDFMCDKDGVPISEIERHPAPRVHDYQNNSVSQKIVDGPPRSVGVYGRFRDPQSGIASADNLSRWSDYAKSSSYTGDGNKAGPGQPPSMPDPRPKGNVPAASKQSDGYLASTESWSSFEFGGDSGMGRLEKAGKY